MAKYIPPLGVAGTPKAEAATGAIDESACDDLVVAAQSVLISFSDWYEGNPVPVLQSQCNVNRSWDINHALPVVRSERRELEPGAGSERNSGSGLNNGDDGPGGAASSFSGLSRCARSFSSHS
jgi:hypothetical protein